jgi:WD40 repeat protein
MASGDAEPTGGKGQPKAKIFISYSRKDLAFADRLEVGLKARGFDTLIDRAEIYALEDWWKRIEALIAQADTIVFVLSPDAVDSDICKREVAFAASLNKRLAPVVYRRVADTAVPEALARLNFIFFDDETRFDASMNGLAEALETDIEWVRKHTEFGSHARRWAEAGRPGPRGLLLRSPILEEAERWIASRPRGAPPATDTTQNFITESRRAATRRRNNLSSILAAGFSVALALSGIAYWQRHIAVEERNIAEQQRAGSMAGLVTNELSLGYSESALRLGVHAARIALALDSHETRIVSPRAALASAAWQSDLRQVLSGNEGAVTSAAFSSDGKRILTTSKDYTARVWDAATGREIAVLRGDEDDLLSAFFSPDGTCIVTIGLRSARIWDAATGKMISVLQGNINRPGFNLSNPEGRRLLSPTMNSMATTFDVAALLRKPDSVETAIFNPGGTRIVTPSSDNTARVWDAATGKEMVILRGHEGAVWSAAFSRDGSRIVTTSEDKTARIWDAATGNEIAVLRGHEGAVWSAAFSRDGSRIVTASWDNTERVWDAAAGKEIAVLRRNEKGIIQSVAFSPDGKRIVTASASLLVGQDDTASIWDAVTGKELSVLRGHQNGISSAVFSPDGKRIVTASNDRTVRIWDAESGKEVSVLHGHEKSVNSAAFSRDGTRIVTASDDQIARIFRVVSAGKEIAVLRGHENTVFSAAFSPQGTRIVTASEDKTARIWDTATATELAVLRGHDGQVNSAAFSPDGKRIITASNDVSARIWDAATGKEITPLRVELSTPLLSATFSPDGRHIVAVYSGGGIVLDTEDKTKGASLGDVSRGPQMVGYSAAFSPDGARVVTGAGDGIARVWEATTGRQTALLSKHENAVYTVAFSPDGTRIVTGSLDYTARIWDATTPPSSFARPAKEIAILRGHENAVSSAAFSPDGARIVTSSEDQTIRIWDTAAAKEIAVLQRGASGISSAAFSSDGTKLVASSGSTAIIWDVRLATMSTQNLVVDVCKRRLRGRTTLSRDEMRLAGYSDDTPEIDVCAGIE